MKKKVIFLLILLFIIPGLADATTLGDYEAKVEEYRNAYNEKQRQINLTDAEIKRTNNQITALKNEMVSLAREIEEIKIQIEKDNKEIEKKNKETKKILSYYQKSKENNVYLEYIFSAQNISDLITKSALVGQISEHNKDTIQRLNKLIEQRKQRRKDIDVRQKEIGEKQEELSELLVKLGNERSSYQEGAVSDKEQLQMYEKTVQNYKNLGCKTNDVIGVDCAKQGESGVFRRPMKKGYITARYGWVPEYSFGFHDGVDISSSNKSEPIYSIANGRVAQKYLDGNGGLTVIVYYNHLGTVYSGLYIHMRSFGPKIRVNNYITSEDLIGYMGSTGFSTGPHLHFAVIPCRIYDPTDARCSTWSRYINYSKQLAKRGWKGPFEYVDLPKQIGASFYGR